MATGLLILLGQSCCHDGFGICCAHSSSQPRSWSSAQRQRYGHARPLCGGYHGGHWHGRGADRSGTQHERLHRRLSRHHDGVVAGRRGKQAQDHGDREVEYLMGVTTDRNDPRLVHGDDETPRPQNEVYLVLSEEERAKGFVRPYRDTYTHKTCGTDTHMGYALSATYARNPKFYSGTFCCHCSMHRPVAEFVWKGTDITVGD